MDCRHLLIRRDKWNRLVWKLNWPILYFASYLIWEESWHTSIWQRRQNEYCLCNWFSPFVNFRTHQSTCTKIWRGERGWPKLGTPFFLPEDKLEKHIFVFTCIVVYFNFVLSGENVSVLPSTTCTRMFWKVGTKNTLSNAAAVC